MNAIKFEKDMDRDGDGIISDTEVQIADQHEKNTILLEPGGLTWGPPHFLLFRCKETLPHPWWLAGWVGCWAEWLDWLAGGWLAGGWLADWPGLGNRFRLPSLPHAWSNSLAPLFSTGLIPCRGLGQPMAVAGPNCEGQMSDPLCYGPGPNFLKTKLQYSNLR